MPQELLKPASEERLDQIIHGNFEEGPVSAVSLQTPKAIVGALDTLLERDNTRLVQVKDDIGAFMLLPGRLPHDGDQSDLVSLALPAQSLVEDLHHQVAADRDPWLFYAACQRRAVGTASFDTA